MEAEAKYSNFPPHNLRKRRTHRESLAVKLESSPEESDLLRKRKTSYLSLSYPPPRPTLPIQNPTPKIEFDDFKSRGEILAKEKGCKCKQSSCVKMYCLCFASSNYCNGCSCSNCQNTVENEEVRQASIGLILQRNQKVFRTKVISSVYSQCNTNGGKFASVTVRYIGCCCKRSQCIQGYCECYQANIKCSRSCKCMNCKNFKTYESTSSKESNKSMGHGNFLDSHKKEQLNCRLEQSWPISRPAAHGPLNFRFRSLLADIIQQQNLMEFCELLIVTAKPVNGFSEIRSPVNLENLSHGQVVKNSAAQIQNEDKGSEHLDSEQDNKATIFQADVLCKNSTSGSIMCTEMPMSPETLPLMYSRKDMLFYPDVSSDAALNQGCCIDVYVEQEKVVLVKLLDYLNILIASGKAKESELSARARSANRREDVIHNFVF